MCRLEGGPHYVMQWQNRPTGNYVSVVLPVMACVPPSPSTSVPSCLQVPSSPAAIKLNWLKRRDKDTLLPIIRAHIFPGTRVMSDKWKVYDCLQDKGYQHLRKLRRPRHRASRIHGGGGKRDLPRAGTSKDLFEIYLHEFLWRRHMERNPLETSSSISPSFTRCTKTRKEFRAPIYTPFVISFRERNKH